MKLNYYQETDSLYIDLAKKPSTESKEISEGIVLDYDADGLKNSLYENFRLILIHLQHSKRKKNWTGMLRLPLISEARVLFAHF